MVGYVLLVVFAVIIGAVVYQWLSTYVPTEPLGCPEGSSLFVKDAIFDSSNSELNLTMRNNGRFNIAGYFIHAKNSSSQELAIIDLSIYLNESKGGSKFGNSVLFAFSGENSLKPGNQKINIFDIPPEIGKPYSVRIIPTRFQEEDNRERFVGCGDARVEQIVGAPPATCTDTCLNLGYECNTQTICGVSTDCGTCSLGFNCDASGQCISSSCTPALDPSLSGICGTQNCGISTATNGTCGTVDCGTCSVGFECTIGQCVSLLGNGVCDPGETCSQEPVACEDQQAQCAPGETCQSGICVQTSGDGICDPWETCSEPDCEGEQNGCISGKICFVGSCTPISSASCNAYCAFLGYSGSPSESFCVQNPVGACQSPNVYVPEGDVYCGSQTGDFCCCAP